MENDHCICTILVSVLPAVGKYRSSLRVLAMSRIGPDLLEEVAIGMEYS